MANKVYEYKVETVPAGEIPARIEWLNKMGEEGWWLVNITAASLIDSGIIIGWFVREKSDE